MPDPRTAWTTLTGPPDLAGQQVVLVDQVTIDGVELYLPKPLPGVPEYVAAARAEAEADRLRPMLVQDLDWRGAIPYQPDDARVFEFYAAAGTVMSAAVAGLESFANHHISRFCPPPTYDSVGRVVGPVPTASFAGQVVTFDYLANMPLNERLSKVLPEFTGRPKPTAEPWWPKLRQVQGLSALARHGVTDPVERRGLQGARSVAQRLVDREYAGAARMMLATFEHFSPGWVSAERLTQLPQPP